jgi:hypothetical protein
LSTVTTKLDDLNKLLAKLEIPTHRKHVDTSGSNLPWLKKHVLSTSRDFMIVELLSRNMNELLMPSDFSITPVPDFHKEH